MEMLISLLVGFLAGLMLAAWLANKRWRDNADQPYSVHSRGCLYKVIRTADLIE